MTLNINDIKMEQHINLMHKDTLDLNEFKKYKGDIYCVNEYGDKSKINPKNYTDDMKSIVFLMSHGFIIVDKIVGNIIKGENNDR